MTKNKNKSFVNKKYTLSVLLMRIFLSGCLLIATVAGIAQPIPGIRANGIIRNTGDTIVVCKNSTIVYQSTATGAATVNWRFNLGSPPTSTVLNVNVLYTTVGTDSTIQVVRNGGQSDSMYIFVRVTDEKPIPGFTFAPDNVCGDIPVSFTNTSTGSGLSFAWDFSDGNRSTVASPVHQFLSAIGPPGSQPYNVKMVVTNAVGCKDSITKPVVIKKVPDASIGNAAVGVVFGIFNGVPTFRKCSNVGFSLFEFVNQSTTMSTNVQYTIKWGDGNPDSVFTSWPGGTPLAHPYPLGSKTMIVEVKGPDGCIGIKQYNIFLGSNPAGGLTSLGNTDVCTADSLRFVINGIANNPPGTIYTFLVNDGSAPQIFGHPPPDTMRHRFNFGSCGFNSSSGNDTYTNAFGAYLSISNPCGSTSPSVVPIYVSGRPKAQIEILPSRTVCVNSTVTIRNVSGFGGVVTPTGGTGSTCSATGKQVWVISPATGYNLTGGSLGSLNGNVQNGLLWTSGSASLNVVFTAVGTYTVKLYISNDRCGVDSTMQTICVRNPPQASFTMSSRSTCNSGTASITNTSPAGGCSGDIYTWGVRFIDPAGCGTGGSFSFINGTNVNSAAPQFQFNSPGQYIVTLTVSAANTIGLVCPRATAADTFTVKSKPRITIPAPGTVCVGNSVNPSVTAVACYDTSAMSYNWTFPGGTPGSSANAVPGPVSYPAAGSYKIFVDVTNQCGTTRDSAAVTITPPPVANAGPDREVCSGAPVGIGTAAVPGIAYQWSPVTGLNNAAAANPTVTLIYTGAGTDTTYSFEVTASAGVSCQSKDTVLVKVKKRPDVNVSAVPLVICAGDSTVLTAAGASAYSWFPPAGLSSITGSPVTARPLVTTTYNVAGTENGCADTAQATITVNNFPATNAGPDTTICNNTNAVQLVGAPSGGTWSGSNISAAGVFNAQAAGNGSYKVYYTAGSNSCIRTDSAIVTVSNPPVAAAGNDTTVCQSNNGLQLIGNPAGGRWSGSAQVSSGGLLNTNTQAAYTLIYTVGSGSCLGTDTVVVNVGSGVSNNTLPPDRNLCISNAAGIITGSVPQGGGGGYGYQWQQSTNPATTWADITGATAADYTPGSITASTCYRRLVSTATCGSALASASNTLCITIRADARAVFTATDTIGCAPFVLGPKITVTPFPNDNSDYTWYADGTPIGSNTTGVFPGYTIGAAGDTTDIKLVTTSRYGCKPDSITRRFMTVSAVTGAFTKNKATGCGPLDVLFTNTSSLLTPAFTYLWNFGNGITSSSIQPGTIRFAANPAFRDTTYYITLKVYNGCDTVYVRDSVKVLPPPNARFAVDTTRGCSQFTPVLTNQSLGNNFIYYWNFGNGVLDTTSSLFGPVPPTYTTGVIDTFAIRLIAENVCGRDTTETDIIVSPRTIQAQLTVSGTSLEGCVPHVARFNNGSFGAARIVWDYGDGTPFDTTANFQGTVTHIYNTAGTFPVRIRFSNDCTDTLVRLQVVVYPKPAAAFTLSKQLLCVGDSIATTNNGINANGYEWRWGDGTTTIATNAVHTYTTPGNYTVQLIARRISNLGIVCTDTASLVVQVVVRIPAQMVINNSGPACAPQVLSVSAVGAAAAASARWTFFDNTKPPGQFFATGLTAAYQFDLPGVYRIKLVVTNAAGCTDSVTQQVTIYPKPVAVVQLDTISTCSRDTIIRCEAQVQYSGTGTVVFNWYVDGVLAGTGNPYFHRFTAPAGLQQPKQFNVQVQPVSPAGCGDTSAGAIFTIQPLPQVRIAVSPGVVISMPDYTFTFTDTIPFSSSKTYVWNLGDRSELRNGRSITHTYGKFGSYLTTLRVNDFSTGCSNADSVRVTIRYVKGTLYVPNAFYPNSAKQELRLFKPEGVGLNAYKLEVFDGQGKLLFATEKLTPDGVPAEGWDGTFNGKPMPQDAYLWRIATATFKNGLDWEGMQYPGKKATRSGTITLFR